jgi:hypothetical protein
LVFSRIKGKAYLKQQILERTDLGTSLHQGFLDRLKAARKAGRSLILVAGLDVGSVENIALGLGFFDDIVPVEASQDVSVLRKHKLLAEVFGAQGFEYIEAIESSTVSGSFSVALNADNPTIEDANNSSNGFGLWSKVSSKSRFSFYLHALRLHQWLKNVLVFVPLVLAHAVSEPQSLFNALVAFPAFGLCASSVYVLNDLFNLAADRRHPTKCRRPFASGALSVKQGLLLAPLLLCGACAFALMLPYEFIAWMESRTETGFTGRKVFFSTSASCPGKTVEMQ